MAIICVADGDCTTWSETIPASAATGANLPFLNIDPDSQITDYEVSSIPRLTFITIDDFGAGVYSVLIEDPNQSGLVCDPQGAPNNILGAVPDCLDGTDPNRLFLWDIAVNGSSARNFVFRQSQITTISTGVSGTNGSFIALRIDTNQPFPPSPYPYLTLVNLSGWVTEFGNAVQVGFNPNEITVNRAACSSVIATNVAVAATGATTWDFTITDPFQSNLVSDPDEAANNVDGSILDCLNSTDPDATLTMGFTISGSPYQVSIPVTQITSTATTPVLDGAELLIQIDTALPYTTADLANTLQADLSLLNGVSGYPTFTLLRCDTINQAQQIQGTGTEDDPLVPNVVLHPDGSIVCGPNGLALTTAFVPTPQGPTSAPDAGGLLFPPNINGCANWICDETGNNDWYAPEHFAFSIHDEDVVTTGIAPLAGFPVNFPIGNPNNHIRTFTITNTFERPLVPRIVCRVQSLLTSPSGEASYMAIEAQVTESWTGNTYVQRINRFFLNMAGFSAAIEDEKSTTFVFSTTGGIYSAFSGYSEIPPGESVTYDINVGHEYGGATAPTWARSVIVTEAALFTTA